MPRVALEFIHPRSLLRASSISMSLSQSWERRRMHAMTPRGVIERPSYDRGRTGLHKADRPPEDVTAVAALAVRTEHLSKEAASMKCRAKLRPSDSRQHLLSD